jgi:hypothetical protein
MTLREIMERYTGNSTFKLTLSNCILDREASVCLRVKDKDCDQLLRYEFKMD